MLKLIHISGNVLLVNSCCYGRCYVKKLIPLCTTLLKFHTHLEENLARSFQNVFDKCSKVLNLVLSRNCIFHEIHHILGYHTTLNIYFAGAIKNLIRPLIRSREMFARLQWPVFSREKFTTVTAYRGFVTKSQLLETLFTRK